jgi:hypothetical protein
MTDSTLLTSPALVSTTNPGAREAAHSTTGNAICISQRVGIGLLEEWEYYPSNAEFGQLLPHLRQLDNDELRHLALQATRLEQYAFRLRGAIASEMRRRVARRLSGGRGRRDHEGKGIRSCLRQLAAEIGVSVVTLTTDARIYDLFFTTNEETVIAHDHSLPREYYVIALAAPDPLAAIRIAQEQAAGNGCTREQFRRYVHTLKHEAHALATGVKRTEALTAVARTAQSRQQVLLTDEARYVLNELMKASHGTAEQIVTDALIAHYHALNETTDVATTAKPYTSRRSRRTATDDDESRQTQPSLLG